MTARSCSVVRDETVAGRVTAKDTLEAAIARAQEVNAGRDGLNVFAWTDDAGFPPSAAARRPGRPVTRAPSFDEASESQDAAVIAVGARVKHRKFGSGIIAELAGSGRDLKAKIDFDDESIGRKTLVVAQANLERDID